ncbi:MAG TPA: family 16 glycoside hydrolase, partial [Pirellula sp.]|nr:family 16 glycoside hydrolase [Pirellula sp.]
MKKHTHVSAYSRFLSVACILSGFVSYSNAEDVQLFNGKDFSNWHGRSTTDPAKWDKISDAEKAKWNQEVKDHWSIEGETIVNDGKGAYLTTNQDFSDFEFSFDYKIVPGSDSGVYLRGIPQVQIWDPNAENNKKNGNEKGSGGLWNNPPSFGGKDPLVRADKPVGEWNAMRIRLIGERCTVWLNDMCVVKNERLANYFAKGEPLYAKGPIQLQTHGAEIRWRNLKLTEFNADEANELLKTAEDSSAKFTSLFNGKDLTGWQGATNNYSIVDGAIQCQAGKGGTLVSE